MRSYRPIFLLVPALGLVLNACGSPATAVPATKPATAAPVTKVSTEAPAVDAD